MNSYAITDQSFRLLYRINKQYQIQMRCKDTTHLDSVPSRVHAQDKVALGNVLDARICKGSG